MAKRTSKPATAPTFVEFCDRIGVPLSEAQRVLAAVSFDGEPVPEEYAHMFGGHVGEVPAAALRTIVWLCGRASGKTRLLAAYLLWRLLYAKVSLARGELGFALLVSPTLDLSGQSLRFARGMLEGTRYERAIVKEDATSFTIKRPDGRLVRFQTIAAKKGGMSGRGKTLIAAALDESCFFSPDTGGAVNDDDVYRALPPRLVEGGSIILASTPWTPVGLTWQYHKDNFGKPSGALVAVAKTEVMRADDPTVLENCARERQRDPDNAARELDCEWLTSGGGTAFDRASLDASIVPDEHVAPADTIQCVYVGGDLAQTKDRTAFVAVRYSKDILEVVDAVEIRKPREAVALSMKAIVTAADDFVARNYADRTVRVDGHVFHPANEAAEDNECTVRFERCSETLADRELRFDRAINAFKSGKVRIPERFAWLADQLSTIVATPRDGGGNRYTAPRRAGSHADGASAFLLAAERMLAERDAYAGLSQDPVGVTLRVLGFAGVGGSGYGSALFGREEQQLTADLGEMHVRAAYARERERAERGQRNGERFKREQEARDLAEAQARAARGRIGDEDDDADTAAE